MAWNGPWIDKKHCDLSIDNQGFGDIMKKGLLT